MACRVFEEEVLQDPEFAVPLGEAPAFPVVVQRAVSFKQLLEARILEARKSGQRPPPRLRCSRFEPCRTITWPPSPPLLLLKDTLRIS